MDDTIRAILLSMLGPLQAVVQTIQKVISSIWSVIVGFFRSVTRAWNLLYASITMAISTIAQMASACADGVGWFITKFVPGLIRSAVNTLVNFIAHQISSLTGIVTNLFEHLLTWINQGLALVNSFIAQLRKWAIDQINSILGQLAAIGKQVFGVLGTAERLAQWAGHAIFTWLVNFVRDNATKFGHMIWAARFSLYDVFTHMIEDFFHSIL